MTVVAGPDREIDLSKSRYNLSVAYLDEGGRMAADDTVQSYFGMREVSLCAVGGVRRPCINGEWRFLTGLLDQVSE